MKLIIKSILIVFGTCLSLSPMIAQTNNNSSPIDFGTTGETSTNPNDAQTAPIDNCIILLFILGMSYALFTLKKITKIKKLGIEQNNLRKVDN